MVGENMRDHKQRQSQQFLSPNLFKTMASQYQKNFKNCDSTTAVPKIEPINRLPSPKK